MEPLGERDLIAPCGINCSVCQAHLRSHRSCPGCRGDDSVKCKTRIHCRIKKCQNLQPRGRQFCSSCEEGPCPILLRLNRRYQAKYGVNVLDNLGAIKKYGLEAFVVSEKSKWQCPKCATPICMHKPLCPGCGYSWHGRLG